MSYLYTYPQSGKILRAVRRHGLSLAFLLGGVSVVQAQTTTPFACTAGKSYILQDDPTVAIEVNVSTGATTATSGPVVNASSTIRKVNAVGYNQKDNYIWGLLINGNRLVQVGSDFNSNLYSITGLSGEGVNSVVGDVSPDGIMYITRGGSTAGRATDNSRQALTIYSIDLTKPSGSNPTTYAATAFGVLPLSTSSAPIFINDWAASPIDGHLYAIYATIAAVNNAPALTLFRILTKAVTATDGTTMAAGTLQTIGTVVPETASGATNTVAASNYASSYMDASGNLFVISSDNGYTYRINTPNNAPFSTTSTASTANFTGYYIGTGPKGGNANVDGARCAASAIAPTPLPVTLAAWAATAAPNRGVQLAWTTASEQHNSFFEVQHSLDGYLFKAVGQVAGHQTTTQASAYSFVDAAPGPEATHYYRLRQVDLTGTSNFSPVRVVTLAAGSSPVQLTVAPNPATPDNLHVQVQYAGSEAAPATLTVHSLLGQTLLAQPVLLQPGSNVLTPILKLAPGAYWLSLNGGASLGQQGVRVLVGN
ncbi:hypothetical protein [Hymenobacter sp. BT559]|uniref:hypothetical protein n=1 Tax=Hymenobacter sp. BT559 TaxID=2795729 RepID=UPI0018EDCD05|nr:hypothetical protein [Hymenobacter sp. BT559]MBJ6142587.1 hypothetical protein [Hymenobacter sp. BT559]